MADLIFWFIFVVIFALGLIVGSFLNCAIFRFGEGESALLGRSRCPKCRRQLAGIDLVPLVSFFVLRGKCRYCRNPISWQYPAVELATAILFLATAWNFYPALFWGEFFLFSLFQLLGWGIFISAMIMVFVADWRWYLIPDGALIVGFFGVLTARASQIAEHYFLFAEFDWRMATDPLAAAFFAGGLFLAIFLASRGKWMGFGDVKLAFLLGFALGFWPALLALFLASFLGAIIGLGMIWAKKKKMSSQIPFGPFLVSGALAAMFFAPQFFNWYLGI